MMRNKLASIVVALFVLVGSINAQQHNTGVCFVQASGSPIGTGTGSAPGSLATGDFNGDGIQDLLVCIANKVKLYLGVGNGSFTSGMIYSDNYITNVVAGDFNGDGKKDFVTCSWDQIVRTMLGNGTGGFSAAILCANINYKPIYLAAADINHDGKLDVITNSSGGSSNYYVLLNNGSGNFTPTQFSTNVDDMSSFCVGDANGDGNLDVILPKGSISTGLAADVALGNGAGSFSSVGWTSNSTFFSGWDNGACHIALGDFNEDGKQDIAEIMADVSNNTAIVSQNFVFISKNTGVAGSNYNAVTSFATGANPNYIAAADFNLDGHLDLVTANTADNNISILIGNGTGNFAAAVNFAVGVNPSALTVSDFNGDGFPDLAISNLNSDNVTILLNALPKITIPTLSLCLGNSGNLAATVTGAATYTDLWNTGATTTSIPVIQPTASSTTYTLKATNSTQQCWATNTGLVKVNPLPSAFTVNSASVCAGSNVTLSATVLPIGIISARTSGSNEGEVDATSNTIVYTWAPATSLNSATGTSVVAHPSTTTVYTITATNSYGCTYTTTATVTAVVNDPSKSQQTSFNINIIPLSSSVVEIQATANVPAGLIDTWAIYAFSCINGAAIPSATSGEYYPSNPSPGYNNYPPITFSGYTSVPGTTMDPNGVTPTIGQFYTFNGAAYYIISHAVAYPNNCPQTYYQGQISTPCNLRLADTTSIRSVDGILGTPLQTLGMKNYVSTNNSDVNVFPNPSTNAITIQSLNNEELGSISVFNLLGGLVYEIKSANSEEQIDISKFAAGVYTIQTKGGKTKLIKE